MLKNKVSGFTLIELMVALALGVTLLISLIAIFMTGMYHSQRTLNAGRLEQYMLSAMLSMEQDIKRSGFWGEAKSGVDSRTNANPFMAGDTDITVNAANNCILVSYDVNKDGLIPAVGDAQDERFGYRLLNNTLQMRASSSQPFDCNAGYAEWSNLTDPNIVEITALTFTVSTKNVDIDAEGPGTSAMIVRYVDITMTGRLAHDTATTLTLTHHIAITNNKYQP